MVDEGESNLEMRCSADEAWYDGTLRISAESKDLIVVHFNDFDEEEDETFHRSDLRDPAKLRSRVRVRSVQLQDSQCRRVYEGQKICGCLDDDEDRKYYDCEVTAIAKRTHDFKDDGEECLCRFTVFWLDGPKKREMTVIGCGDVCFLSLERPEDDLMVKNLLESLPGPGDQPRRKLVKNGTKTAPKSAPPKSVAPPKPVVLPRPRTPSPSLELAPSKKQPSREPSPPVEAPTQTAPELARTKSLPIGSKKKRIMQAAVQAASDNDRVETSAPKDQNAHRAAAEGDEDVATGHGDESVAAERRVLRGAPQAGVKKRVVKGRAKEAAAPEVTNHVEAPREEDDTAPRPTGPVKKQSKPADGDEDVATGNDDESVAAGRRVLRGAPQAGVKKRIVKGKAKQAAAPEVTEKAKEAAAPEVTNHVEVPREEDDTAPRPTGPVKKRMKLTTKSKAKAVKVSETVEVTQSLAERVKLKKAERKPDAAAAPAPAAAASPPAAESPKQPDNIVQSLGERVKLKTAQKNPSAATSPAVDAHKDSLQKIGKQFVRKQVTKRKLIQLEDLVPDPLRSKFDKVVKPKSVPLKRKEPVAAPPEPPKAADPEPPTPSQSTAAPETQQPKPLKRKAGRPRKNPPKNQTSSAQNHNPPKEATLPSNPRSNLRASKKRPRVEEEQPEEQAEEEVEQPRDEEEQPRDEEEQPHGEEEQPHGEEEQPQDEEEQPQDEEEQAHDEEQQAHDVEEQAHVEEEQLRDEEEEEEEEQSHHDTISETRGAPPSSTGKLKTLLIIGDLNQEAQNDTSEPEVEAGAIVNKKYKENKVSIAEKFRDIQNKYHRNVAEDSVLSSPQAAMELMSMAGRKDDDNSEDEETEEAAVAQQGKADEWAALDEEERTRGRVLVVENMEVDTSAFDALQLLAVHTNGVCAVHILPVPEFHVTATAYALYRDAESAFKALRWLTSSSRFVVSPNGRPWLVSQAKEVYGPKLFGFAAHSAYKSDDHGMCGLISDQPHVHDLVVVTQRDDNAYCKAHQMSKAYEEQKKWRKELYDRIVQHNKG